MEEVIEWDDNGEDDEDARIELALVGKIWTNRNVNANALLMFVNPLQNQFD